MKIKKNLIIGAGITGLATGYASGYPIYEASDRPGGICRSYYIRPKEIERINKPPSDNEAFRFEIGGGHWMFGVENKLLRFIKKYSNFREYKRRSSVYFFERDKYVPFPIQNHLNHFDTDFAARAISEMIQHRGRPVITMKEWLCESFGETLCSAFFFPFNDLYTAGLYGCILPQDLYKSPININSVVKGAFSKMSVAGYNSSFYYPERGLDQFVNNISNECEIHYEKELKCVDIKKKTVCFSDNSEMKYHAIISTIPLNKMVQLSKIEIDDEQYPYTSVLILNIGAKKGQKCPDDHWLYVPFSKSKFHRIGFYSNVDRSFLPLSSRTSNDKVSIYVEKSYLGGKKPGESEKQEYKNSVINELREWGFIDEIEAADFNWVEVAYTWASPRSKWKEKAINKLEQHSIYQIGRYGNWEFQGIAESIKNGLYAGTVLR